MVPTLKALERVIRPIELIERLEMPVNNTGTTFVTTCPSCGSSLWILPSSVLCNNDTCKMLSGSVGEIALAHLRQRGEANFHDAIQLLLRTFEARLSQYPEIPLGTNSLVNQLRQRRHLLTFLRGLRREDRMSGEKAAMLSALQNQHVHDPSGSMFLPLSAQEATQLGVMLQTAGVTMPPIPPDRPLLLIPYFTQPHVLSSLVLTELNRSWRVRIDLQEAEIAFAGLWQLGPSVQRVLLHDNPVDAAQQNANWGLFDTRVVSLAYLIGTGLPDEPLDIPQPTGIWHPTSLVPPANLVRLQGIFDELQVYRQDTSKILSFDAFTLALLKRYLTSTGRLSGQGLVVLGSINPQGIRKNRLHRALLHLGHIGAADQLARTQFSVEISRTDKTILLSTPDGYAVKRSGKSLDLLTNFTLLPTSNVTFGDHSPPHHGIKVLLRDIELTTMVPTRMLDSSRDLQAHLQIVASAHGILDAPTVRDTGGSFKQVTHYLRSLLPQLPVRRGLPFLGWDMRRETFYMPGCVVGMDGLIQESMPMHPDLRTLDGYNDTTGDTSTAIGLLPRELQTHILLILGSIILGFRNMPLRPVQIRHDGKAVALLTGLFRGLGQERGLTKMQNRLPGLSCYPAWTTATMRGTGSINEPFFVLAEQGREVEGTYDEKELATAAKVLRGLTILTIEGLLAQASPYEWQRTQTVLYSNDLITTAQGYLQSMGIETQPEMLHYEWTEKLLRQIPKTDLQDVFSYDFGAQTISMTVEPYRDTLDLVSLEIELRQLMEHVKIDTGYHIQTDAASMFNLLRQYYGGSIPQLKEAD